MQQMQDPAFSSARSAGATASTRRIRSSPLPALVTPFASALLEHDFSDLSRRTVDDTVTFIVGRLEIIPSITRLGVTVIAAIFRLLMLLLPFRACLRLATGLPLAAEYVRLLRSLAYARIWETEPSTGPTGRVAGIHVQ